MMPQDEMNTWVAYVEENGPLNLALRFESMIARVAAPQFKNTKARDLMVWPRIPEPEATPQSLGMMLKGIASRKNQRNH